MSLHGSLDSFPITDVLALLATTRKTGELRVRGDGTAGRLWVDGGKVVAGSAGVQDRPVDVVFELLRLEDGEFTFDAGVVAPVPGPPIDVADLLEEAEARLVEWRAIEAVLPSAEHVVALAAEAPGPVVQVTAERWRVLAAVAGGRTVGHLLGTLADDELVAARLLKGVVEDRMCEVREPVRAARPAPAPEPVAPPAAEPAAVEVPALEVPLLGTPLVERELEPSGIDALAAFIDAAAEAAGAAVAAPVVQHEPAPAPAAFRVHAPAEDPWAAYTATEGEVRASVEDAEDHLAADEGGDPDEVINRGLLLKLLSSVKG